MVYVALDWETSGLLPGTHAHVSLGVAVMEDGEVLHEREWLIAPPMKNGNVTREYAVNALEKSRYTWPQIKRDGLAIRQVMQEFTEWLAHKTDVPPETPVVAFNAPFDLAWYSEALFLAGEWNNSRKCFELFRPPITGPWHCARLMAMGAGLGLDKYDLDTVAGHFGFARTSERHGASEDAVLAGKVYAKLVGLALPETRVHSAKESA